MTNGNYEAALEQAKADFSASQRQLSECIRKQEDLEVQLGNLRETIAALCRIAGQEFVEEDPPGLTDSIRLTFKTAPGQRMTALDVRERIKQLGYDLSSYHNVLASIHAVLKRLEAMREIRKARTISGKTAYIWMPRLGFHPFRSARTKIKVSK